MNSSFLLEYISDTTVRVEIEDEEVLVYNYSNLEGVRQMSQFEYFDTILIGDTLQTEYYKFSIKPTEVDFTENTEYSFVFRDLSYLLNRYSTVDIVIPKGSSIINLSLKHNNPHKASTYLNTLVKNYLFRGIERETRIAQLTIDFIDMQVNSLVDSLKMSEQQLESFRSDNEIVDIEYQAQQVYSRQYDLERQEAELIMSQKYLEYLSKSLQANSITPEELVAPSTIGINDPVLNNLVLELVEQYNERTELMLNSRRDNPYITSLAIRIESTKKKASETVNNLLHANSISLQEMKVQIADVSERLSKLPKDQRELLNFQRTFDLNDELYTYLLTRRSEMQIKKASTLPTNEFLDEAVPSDARLISPNKRSNYFIGLIIGIVIPFCILLLKVMLNVRIQSHDDIKKITDLPIIGTIYENDNLELPVFINDPTSIVAESFRMLRANLQFVVANSKTPVIVVSSAMKGEGKSYTAINLAAVYASYGNKVCLVDLDLRRPKLAKYLSVESEKGMSNCLIRQEKIENIKISIDKSNFDLYPSGPIPPNPSELVASTRLKKVIEELKAQYDIIILDSPPFGMVSDALLISKLAGYMLLVVRHNITHIPLLTSLIDEMQRNQINGLNLVYNDVPSGKKGYYKYGYRYGYHSDEKKPLLSRLFG